MQTNGSSMKLHEARVQLTFGQDEVVLLDEALEVILLELRHIGCECDGGQQAAEGEAVTHCGTRAGQWNSNKKKGRGRVWGRRKWVWIRDRGELEQEESLCRREHSAGFYYRGAVAAV